MALLAFSNGFSEHPNKPILAVPFVLLNFLLCLGSGFQKCCFWIRGSEYMRHPLDAWHPSVLRWAEKGCAGEKSLSSQCAHLACCRARARALLVCQASLQHTWVVTHCGSRMWKQAGPVRWAWHGGGDTRVSESDCPAGWPGAQLHNLCQPVLVLYLKRILVGHRAGGPGCTNSAGSPGPQGLQRASQVALGPPTGNLWPAACLNTAACQGTNA